MKTRDPNTVTLRNEMKRNQMAIDLIPESGLSRRFPLPPPLRTTLTPSPLSLSSPLPISLLKIVLKYRQNYLRRQALSHRSFLVRLPVRASV